MHKYPIFTKDFPPESGYVIIDKDYYFSGVGMTKERANEFRMAGDLYRINVKLKENTNA